LEEDYFSKNKQTEMTMDTTYKNNSDNTINKYYNNSDNKQESNLTTTDESKTDINIVEFNSYISSITNDDDNYYKFNDKEEIENNYYNDNYYINNNVKEIMNKLNCLKRLKCMSNQEGLLINMDSFFKLSAKYMN
jgi:hypothetical protein